MNQATQLRTTPMFAPPGQAYGVAPTYQPAQRNPFASGLGRAAGYYATQQMLGGLGTAQPTYGTTDPAWQEWGRKYPDFFTYGYSP